MISISEQKIFSALDYTFSSQKVNFDIYIKTLTQARSKYIDQKYSHDLLLNHLIIAANIKFDKQFIELGILYYKKNWTPVVLIQLPIIYFLLSVSMYNFYQQITNFIIPEEHLNLNNIFISVVGLYYKYFTSGIYINSQADEVNGYTQFSNSNIIIRYDYIFKNHNTLLILKYKKVFFELMTRNIFINDRYISAYIMILIYQYNNNKLSFNFKMSTAMISIFILLNISSFFFINIGIEYSDSLFLFYISFHCKSHHSILQGLQNNNKYIKVDKEVINI